MRLLRRVTYSTLVLGGAGLAGPLIRWITWPPSEFEHRTSYELGYFVAGLVLLLWPAQPLATVEASLGEFIAGVIAVVTNVLLFAILGGVIGLLSWRSRNVAWTYVTVSACVLLFALWGSGWSLTFLNWPALLTALFLYGIPFYVIAQFEKW
jgi:hypothetical protein